MIAMSLGNMERKGKTRSTMSATSTYTITCPKCEQPEHVELHDAINVTEEPELKEKFLRNQINRVVCSQCDMDFRVDKNLLYTDLERRILCYLMPCSLAELEETRRAFEEKSSMMRQITPSGLNAPELHLVISRAELVERIFLCEAGLNPRLIEYIKYIIHVRNPERANPRTTQLLFNAEDSTDTILLFMVQDLSSGQFTGALEYGRAAYKALEQALEKNDDQAATIMELFPGPYISARANILHEEDVEDVLEDKQD